jgi:hypothetical protein
VGIVPVLAAGTHAMEMTAPPGCIGAAAIVRDFIFARLHLRCLGPTARHLNFRLAGKMAVTMALSFFLSTSLRAISGEVARTSSQCSLRFSRNMI